MLYLSCKSRKARCEPLSPSAGHWATTKSGGVWEIEAVAAKFAKENPQSAVAFMLHGDALARVGTRKI